MLQTLGCGACRGWPEHAPSRALARCRAPFRHRRTCSSQGRLLLADHEGGRVWPGQFAESG
eukprot:scaffold118224_cov67-Phaeocystis_antarctica.AAC.1